MKIKKRLEVKVLIISLILVFSSLPFTYAQTAPIFSLSQNSSDFLVQVVNYYPKVIRSDLLEEQNVPVFAQIRLIKNNPIIGSVKIRNIFVNPVKEIDGIAFPFGNVTGIAYNPPPTGPTLSNAGYVQAIINRQENEIAIPNKINIPLKADIIYDSEFVQGIRVEDKILRSFPSPEKDDDWNRESSVHSFWNKAGYVRVTEISGSQVKGLLYDSRLKPISSFTLNKEIKDFYFRLPQLGRTTFTGTGQGKISLVGLSLPKIRARLSLNIGGQRYVTVVAEGERLYKDSNWIVKSIVPDNLGGGEVVIVNELTGERKTLRISLLKEEEKQKIKQSIQERAKQLIPFLSPEDFGKAALGEGYKGISSRYCADRSRKDPNRRFHYGYDFPTSTKTPVRVVYDGEVIKINQWSEEDANDKAVWIKSFTSEGEPFVTIYGHIIPATPLKEGDEVKKGDVIAKVLRNHLDVKMIWWPGKDPERGWWKTAFNFDKGVVGYTDRCIDTTNTEKVSINSEIGSGIKISGQVTKTSKAFEEASKKEMAVLKTLTKINNLIGNQIKDSSDTEKIMKELEALRREYSNAIENYWKIIYQYPQLEIPENFEELKDKRYWAVASLERIISLSKDILSVLKPKEGFAIKKEVEEEVNDFSEDVRLELIRASEELKINYPEFAEEETEAFLKYNMNNAIVRVKEIQKFEQQIGFIRYESQIEITLLGISVPDLSKAYADVSFINGETTVTLYEGDVVAEFDRKISVNKVTPDYVTIGGVTIYKDQTAVIPGLEGFEISFINSRTIDFPTTGQRNAVTIKLKVRSEKPFKKRFIYGTRFLGRIVEIEDDFIVLKSEANTIKPNLIIRNSLGGIKTSISIHSEKEVHLRISPAIPFRKSTTYFLLHVSVEKRLIKLSPEAMLNQSEKSRKVADKINNITKSLDKTISVWRKACFLTSSALFTKNFFENLQGKGKARERVMEAYKEFCAEQVGFNKKYKNYNACFLDHKNDIEKATEITLKAEKEIASLLEGTIVKERIGDEELEIVDTVKFKELLKKRYTGEYNEDIDNALNAIALYESETGQRFISVSDAKELILKLEIKHQARTEGIGVLEKTYKRLSSESLDKLLKEGTAIAELNVEFEKVWSSSPGEIYKKVNEIPKRLDKGELLKEFSESWTTKNAIGPLLIKVKKAEGNGKTGEEYEEYAIVFERGGWKWKKVIYDKGRPVVEVGEEKKVEPLMFINTCTLEKESKNIIRFYGSGPYKGKPYVAPFPYNKGNGMILVLKYDAIGTPTEAIISAPTSEGRCEKWFYSKVQGAEINPEITRMAFEAVRYFSSLKNKDYGKVITVDLFGEKRKYGIGREKISVMAEPQCEDFMSPQDCEILFQVCDAVVCPPSRFNLGGRWEVRDVVQTGVIGSIMLGMPNYPHPVVPVCLPGISAGLQNYASILRSYADCMEESAKTGKTSGICDRIRSVYVCEMLWKEGLAVANTQGGLIDLLGKALSKNKGGKEYATFNTFKESLNKVSESVKWFTTTYAAPIFTAFKSRTGQEIGTYICRAAFFGRLPGTGSVLSQLSKPEKPPQFFAFMEEIPYSSIGTASQFRQYPQSQYKVFFHIYAGEDKGIFYRVYLKDMKVTPGLPTIPIYEIGNVKARGFIPAGQFVSETLDFLAPSGFRQVCVEIDGIEYCGFKKVSTDFLINYASDLYLKKQLEKPVKNAEECISGTKGLVPLAELPFAGTTVVSDTLEGGIQRRGIVRVCAAQNPGKGIDSERWKVVGTCGVFSGEELKCWLDTSSIKNAVTDLKVEKTTLTKAEKLNYEFLLEQGFLTPEQSKEKLDELELEMGKKDLMEGDYKTIISKAKGIVQNSIDAQSRVRALFLIAEVYSKIAKSKRLNIFERKEETQKGMPESVSSVPSKSEVRRIIAQKIISTAKKLELTKEQQKLVLKVAKQESGIRHCKDGSLNCTEEGVLCGDNGDSCGVFQISRKSHPDAYNPELNPSPECEGKTAYDLDCNIYWGVRILKNYFDEYKGKYYKCKGKDVYYSGEDAALRRYNGWPSTCAGDSDYVENVKGQDISEFLYLLEEEDTQEKKLPTPALPPYYGSLDSAFPRRY